MMKTFAYVQAKEVADYVAFQLQFTHRNDETNQEIQ